MFLPQRKYRFINHKQKNCPNQNKNPGLITHTVAQQEEMVFDKGTFIKILGKRKNAPTLAVTHQYVVRALDGFYTETANGSTSSRFMIFLACHRL